MGYRWWPCVTGTCGEFTWKHRPIILWSCSEEFFCMHIVCQVTFPTSSPGSSQSLSWRFTGVLTTAPLWSTSWSRWISALTTYFCKIHFIIILPLLQRLQRALYSSDPLWPIINIHFSSLLSFQIYLISFYCYSLSFSISVVIFLFPLIYFLFYRASCFLFSFLKYCLVFVVWNIF